MPNTYTAPAHSLTKVSYTYAITVEYKTSIWIDCDFNLELTEHPRMRMGEATNNNTQSIADYLAQLLKDKKQLAAFPNVFVHMERLLDDGKLSCPSLCTQRILWNWTFLWKRKSKTKPISCVFIPALSFCIIYLKFNQCFSKRLNYYRFPLFSYFCCKIYFL